MTATADFMKVISTSEPFASRPAVTPAQPVTTAAVSKPGPTLVKVRTRFSTFSLIAFFLCTVLLQVNLTLLAYYQILCFALHI